jgi:hypothetical protein
MSKFFAAASHLHFFRSRRVTVRPVRSEWIVDRKAAYHPKAAAACFVFRLYCPPLFSRGGRQISEST